MQITLTNKKNSQAGKWETRQIPRCNKYHMREKGRNEEEEKVSQSQRITSKLNPN